MKKRKLLVIVVLLILVSYFVWIFTAKPPKGEVTVYKGLWLPLLGTFPIAHPVSFNLNKIKSTGVSIISFGPLLTVDKDGRVSTLFWQRYLTIFQIKRLHRKGLRVMLTNEIVESMGEPKPLSKEILENPDFWANLNRLIVENAKLAEKYGVEIYAPLNEPEVKFQNEPNRAWEWAQEILPQIKEVYHGKIAWKGDLSAQIDNPNFNLSKANFSGYDIVGFSISLRIPPEEYRDYVDRVIETLKPIAQRYEATLMVTEFGAWDDPWNENITNVRFAYETVLGEGHKNNLKGFFALEGPSIVTNDPTFSDFEKVLRKWYKEKL